MAPAGAAERKAFCQQQCGSRQRQQCAPELKQQRQLQLQQRREASLGAAHPRDTWATTSWCAAMMPAATSLRSGTPQAASEWGLLLLPPPPPPHSSCCCRRRGPTATPNVWCCWPMLLSVQRACSSATLSAHTFLQGRESSCAGSSAPCCVSCVPHQLQQLRAALQPPLCPAARGSGCLPPSLRRHASALARMKTCCWWPWNQEGRHNQQQQLLLLLLPGAWTPQRRWKRGVSRQLPVPCNTCLRTTPHTGLA